MAIYINNSFDNSNSISMGIGVGWLLHVLSGSTAAAVAVGRG